MPSRNLRTMYARRRLPIFSHSSRCRPRKSRPSQGRNQFVLIFFHHVRTDDKHQFISVMHLSPSATDCARESRFVSRPSAVSMILIRARPCESFASQCLHVSGLRLKRFMAAAGPSFKITSTASAAVSSTSSTVFSCALRKESAQTSCRPQSSLRRDAQPDRKNSCVPTPRSLLHAVVARRTATLADTNRPRGASPVRRK